MVTGNRAHRSGEDDNSNCDMNLETTKESYPKPMQIPSSSLVTGITVLGSPCCCMACGTP